MISRERGQGRHSIGVLSGFRRLEACATTATGLVIT
jgi:hypothetical protein